jgi:hypothetical protein
MRTVASANAGPIRMPITLLIALPALLLAASAAALAIALRGRRVDDHPVCRQCGFDLFGKPQGATVCSECGADLTRDGAVRIGRREKRRRLIGFALPVLLVCVAWFALLGWGAARGTDWNKHKPVWWLIRDARTADDATRDGALRELTDRIANGKLTRQRIDALVDLALEVQADPARPWATGWGDAIGAAHDAGKLAPEKWRRYARQGVGVKLRTRGTLRRGDPLVFALDPDARRLSPRHWFAIEYGTEFLRIGETPVTRQRDQVMRIRMKGGETYHTGTRLMPADPAAIAALPDGPHTLRTTLHLLVTEPGAAAPLVDEDVEVTAPLTIVPAGTRTLTVRTDPQLKAAVDNAFSVELRVNETAGIEALVVATQPPVATAFRVFARRGGREWEIGKVSFPAGRTSRYLTGRPLSEIPDFDPQGGPVDVVLKPSVDVTVTTLDLTEIWGGEVVLKDVPVSEGARRSTRARAAPPATSRATPR